MHAQLVKKEQTFLILKHTKKGTMTQKGLISNHFDIF